jgi:hypothetical protein
MAELLRPESVPVAAAYNDEASLWELADRDERGVLHGAFSTFHTNGVLFSRGSYREGKLDGTVSRFSDGTPGSRPLRACCVPPGARELRTRYREGVFVDETFFDEQGRPLTEDGTPWPERHANVPESARFEAASGRFLDRVGHGDTTTLRVYYPNGTLDEEVELVDGRAQVHRRFAPDGSCREQTELDERGARHGGFFARYAENEGPYVDTRIREVRGRYEHGEPVGSFEFGDASGALVKRVEYGAVFGANATALVAGTEPDTEAEPDVLFRLANDAATAPREAVALAARALAASGDRARFAHFLAQRTLALRPEFAGANGPHAPRPEQARPSALLGALLAGAEPAMLLRALASSLADHAPAALAYFDASVLLVPEQPLIGLGRALLCIEHGEPEGALRAAELAERQASDAAEPLRQFSRVTYGKLSFRPAEDGVETPAEELTEVEALQPLPAVSRTLELYATRLFLLRSELVRRARGTPSWLPPDTSELLPRGLIELGRYTARIEDEGENGPEVSEVAIDETLALERSTRRLLATARADWAALCWLCWISGLDRVARPERLAPRPDFAAAAHQAMVRCWRAHDCMKTKGLVALARDIKGFEWEGMPIDQVPPHLIEVAAAEYLEVRALFFWALFPQNQSPFQSDLRRA